MAESGIVRCGVVGLGLIGRLHAGNLDSLHGVDLAVCVDVNPDAESACPDGSRFETDPAAVADARLDGVIVATPEHLHRAAVELALDSGVTVLCEKPFASTLEDVDVMIEAARESQGNLFVAHSLRFDPRYRAVHEASVSGRLGEVRQLAARRAMTRAEASVYAGRTDLALCLGVHDLDVMRWCAGDVDRVYAESGLPWGSSETAESLVATIRFTSGAVGVLELNWALPERTGLWWDTYFACIGSERSAYVDLRGTEPSALGDVGSLQPELTYVYEVAGVPGGVLRLQDELFVRELREPGSWPGPSLVDARRAVELALALNESAASGNMVELSSSP